MKDLEIHVSLQIWYDVSVAHFPDLGPTCWQCSQCKAATS